MRCLILGCGYVGSRFADYSASNGWETSATSRSASKLAELTSQGVQVLEADWLDPPSLRALPRVDYLLISISHAQVPGMSPESVHSQGLQNLFAVTGRRSRESSTFPQPVCMGRLPEEPGSMNRLHPSRHAPVL